jgi:hypothetical protein
MTKRPRREALVTPEVVLGAGHASFLAGGAFVLERLSAHTHRRPLRYRTAGFTYDADLDHWQCPVANAVRAGGDAARPAFLDRETWAGVGRYFRACETAVELAGRAAIR